MNRITIAEFENAMLRECRSPRMRNAAVDLLERIRCARLEAVADSGGRRAALEEFRSMVRGSDALAAYGRAVLRGCGHTDMENQPMPESTPPPTMNVFEREGRRARAELIAKKLHRRLCDDQHIYSVERALGEAREIVETLVPLYEVFQAEQDAAIAAGDASAPPPSPPSEPT